MFYSNSKIKLKRYLKNINFIFKINAFIKCYDVKRNYRKLCKTYNSYSVLDKSNASNWSNIFTNEFNEIQKTKSNLNIFYIGTSFNQDNSGFLQALSEFGKVFLYNGPENKNQLKFPVFENQIDEVRKLNGETLLREFNEISKSVKIDVIIGQMWNYLIPNDALMQLRNKYEIKIVNIGMDDRHSFHKKVINNKFDGGVYGLFESVDLFCTTAPECVSWYSFHNKKAIFLPEASNNAIFKSLKVEKKYDIVFIGSKYGYRAKIVNYLLKNGINIYCRGFGWPEGTASIDESIEIFNQSKIIFGIGGILHCKYFNSLKLRDFDAPMTGSLYLTQYNPDLELCYNIGSEIIVWHNIQDLLEKTIKYLNNEQLREEVANNGMKRALKDHQWTYRISKIFNNL